MKRGYYVVDYTKRSVTSGALEDVDGAYRLARWWYYQKLHGRTPWWAEADDMIQEAVLRLVELAGDPRMGRRSFRINVIKTVMSDYLRNNRKHDHEDQEEIDSRKQWTEWRFKDGGLHYKESAPTWRRKHSATKVMCDIIEAKGIAPLTGGINSKTPGLQVWGFFYKEKLSLYPTPSPTPSGPGQPGPALFLPWLLSG